MEHLELLSGVTAHEVEESLGTTGVLIKPVGEVEDNTLDNDPEVLLGVVLGNLLDGELLLGDGEGLGRRAGIAAGAGTGGAGGLRSRRVRAAGTAPLDGDLARLRGVDVKGDLAKTRSAGTSLQCLLEEVVAGRVTGNTAVDDTAEERRTTETVGTVDTTSKLTAGVEAIEGLLVLVEDLGLSASSSTPRLPPRSEERRGGKECRSRWSPYH